MLLKVPLDIAFGNHLEPYRGKAGYKYIKFPEERSRQKLICSKDTPIKYIFGAPMNSTSLLIAGDVPILKSGHIFALNKWFNCALNSQRWKKKDSSIDQCATECKFENSLVLPIWFRSPSPALHFANASLGCFYCCPSKKGPDWLCLLFSAAQYSADISQVLL